MDISPRDQQFLSDADNIELAQTVERLSGFGLTQIKIAEILGISGGQLSRILKGERHASKKHIRALGLRLRELTKERRTAEQALSHRPFRHSLFDVSHGALNRLSAQSAVEAFRDLLWARATQRAVSTTRISISSEVFAPDGGVDASIVDDTHASIEGDELLTNGSRFQIKTGEFKAWQKSAIKKELFGDNPVRFENLGAAIQQAIQEGKRFILVCFGIDPTDEQRRQACKHLKTYFAECGYSDTSVDVWAQTHLIGLFRQYPSLCLRVCGHDQQGFRSHSSWARDEDMQPDVHYSPEHQQIMEELITGLHSGDIRHLRLLGEPGVGKTRMALELTHHDQLAAATLYFKGGSEFLRGNSFIQELMQVDDNRFVVLVIDECRRDDRAEIWNITKSRSDRIRLITIDHDPDDSTDKAMRVHEVTPASEEQIVAILKDHHISELDAKHWAGFCEGCPRVAHVIGENLRFDRSNLLQGPAINEVWNRFIIGYEETTSDEVELRRNVLRHVSLFERFGFESPVDNEARFIAELAGIPWPRFQSIVNRLKQRRILQGTKTLYVTPRALHVHLYREFWNIHGSTFDIAANLKVMPHSLRRWFVQMLRFAHESSQAESAIDKLLGYSGLFPGNSFPDNQESGQLISSLAEASPRPTLRCLQRTIGEMSLKDLNDVTTSRQWVVWALERLAVWDDCFVGAASLLLKLAEAENATNLNNATGTFRQLCSLIPGMACTQAHPSTRLLILQQALESDSAEQRRVGLKGCESALSTNGGMRHVGPEYQGLRRTIKFWTPKTYGELWDAYRDVWRLLVSQLNTWEGSLRNELISCLINSSWSALYISPLTEEVLHTLERISHDSQTDVKALVSLIQRLLRHKSTDLSEDVKARLKSICDSLDGHDFASKLRRFVKYPTWEDSYSEDGDRSGRLNAILDDLADEAKLKGELLSAEIPWLVCEDSSAAYCFGFRLGRWNLDRSLLSEILNHQHAQIEESQSSFLSGYLAAVYERNVAEWETVMLELATHPAIANCFSDFVIRSGISDSVVSRVIDQCRRGGQDKKRLERWCFSSRLQNLSPTVLEQLVMLHLDSGSGLLWSNAVRICHTYLREDNSCRILPEELMFRVLTHDAMADDRIAHGAGYYWSKLASAFIKEHPERTWEFFRCLLISSSREWSVLDDLNTNEEQVLTTLLRKDPVVAFGCITDVYREIEPRNRFGMRVWLSEGGHRLIGDDGPGPIQFVPSEILFDWVDLDVDDHGYWITDVLPKTLDHSIAGRLTRDFIARYGGNKEILRALHSRFHSRGWVGSASEMYRGLREEARTWLVDEKNRHVVSWIEDYIYGLADNIEREELDEERRR